MHVSERGQILVFLTVPLTDVFLYFFDFACKPLRRSSNFSIMCNKLQENRDNHWLDPYKWAETVVFPHKGGENTVITHGYPAP